MQLSSNAVGGPVGGVFIFIGFTPNQITDIANHDRAGFFVTYKRM